MDTNEIMTLVIIFCEEECIPWGLCELSGQ